MGGGRKPRQKGQKPKSQVNSRAEEKPSNAVQIEAATAQTSLTIADRLHELTCIWCDPVTNQCCGKTFSSIGRFQNHQRNGHHVPFQFGKLPPEIRNRIFRLFLDRDDVNFFSKKTNLACIFLTKQIYSDYKMFRYQIVGFEVSGRGWCKKECVNLTDRLASEEEEDIEIRRYSCRGLQLDHKLAEHVQHWDIAIDTNQYSGDVLFPTGPHSARQYRDFIQLKRGRFSFNWWRMCHFSRFFRLHGKNVKSITLRLFHPRLDKTEIKAASLPRGSFLLQHVIESLSPLLSIRDVKEIKFDESLRSFMGAQGQDAFLAELKRRVESRSTTIGGITEMEEMHNRMEELLDAFDPHERKDPWTILYEWQGPREDLATLQDIVETISEPCWASVMEVQDRVLRAVVERKAKVTKARAEVRNDPYSNRKLVRLLSAFTAKDFSIINYTCHDDERDPENPDEYHWFAEVDMMLEQEPNSTEHKSYYDEILASMDVVIEKIESAYKSVLADKNLLEGVVAKSETTTSTGDVVD